MKHFEETTLNRKDYRNIDILKRRKMEYHTIISVDFSNKDDVETMFVGRIIRRDGHIVVVNAFQGDEAKELYEKLVTNKSSLYMKE